MRKNKSLILLLLIFNSVMILNGYTQNVLTLSQCYEQAIENLPLQNQKLYLETISELNTKNHRAINYPQLMLNAQASYQSDVFSLPFQVPGVESPVIPREQYKVGVDFYQNIYNGGVSRYVTERENAKMQVDLQALEITFHQVRETVNSLYFGILKAQEQTNIIENTHHDLSNQKTVLEAAVNEGAALPMSVKVLEKEIISLEQKLIEIESVRSSLLAMLGKWIEQPLDADITLEMPETGFSVDFSIQRPESRQFELQMDLLESQKSTLTASRIPDIGIFGTAGMGYPNPFNWFEVEFTPYWMAGIKLSWNILDYGKASRDKEVLGLKQQDILSAKENFERSLEIKSTRQTADISKLEQLIEKDRQIVQLQEEIIAVASSQLENGVINSSEYILEVTKGLNANISLHLHEIDLAKTKIELLTLTGNTEKL